MAKISELYTNVIKGGISRSNEYVVGFSFTPGKKISQALQGTAFDEIRLNYFGFPNIADQNIRNTAGDYDKFANNNNSKLNFLCDELFTPGVNYSYGTSKGLYNGNDVKYAYGKTYSDISMSFSLDRNSYPKKFFDTWMRVIADTDNGAQDNINSPILLNYPDDYCADIIIVKLERDTTRIGNVNIDPLTNVALSAIPGVNSLLVGLGGVLSLATSNGKILSSIYHVKRAFPSSITPIQLSNGMSNLLKINVTFTYQRWWVKHFNI